MYAHIDEFLYFNFLKIWAVKISILLETSNFSYYFIKPAR